MDSTLPAPQTWLRPLFIALLLALGLYGLLLVYHAAHLASSTGELNYAEGTWLFAALRVRDGLNPYFEYSHPPYIATVYPPLDFALAGGLGALLGLPDDGVITLARLVTLAAMLLAGAGILIVCRTLRAGWLPSLVAALLFYTPTHTFLLWSYVARADMLAVALGVCAMACVMRRPASWGALLGGALAGLALASKQTAVAPLLACAWWLLPRERRRGLLPLLAGFAGALLAVLAPLGANDDELLLGHTLDLASQPWLPGPLYARLTDFVTLFGLIMPVALLGVFRSATPVPGRGLMLRYGAVAALVALLTVGKLGSASSYLLELFAVLSVFAGLGLQWLTEVAEVPREVMVGLLLLAVTPVVIQAAQALNTAQSFRDPGPDDRPLRAMASVERGPVLSEDSYILLHGADPPVLLDPFYFSALASVGRWDPMPLARMAEERRFSAVVLTRPVEMPLTIQGVSWIPAPVLKEVAQNYVLSGTQGRYYVYVPRR